MFHSININWSIKNLTYKIISTNLYFHRCVSIEIFVVILKSPLFYILALMCEVLFL